MKTMQYIPIITSENLSCEDLLPILYRMDKNFVPPFSNDIDLQAYAEKLAQRASTVICRIENEIVGLLAFYRNTTLNELYIPYICTVTEYQGKGIGHRMINFLENNERGFNTIALEVLKTNTKGIDFYLREGFTIAEDKGSRYLLKKVLTDDKCLLSVRCFTYNQAKFIRQCLNGFIMQKTNFRFEALVHDDASTDGTTNIIREYAEKYPDIIKPIFETENQYSKHDGSLERIMNEAMSPDSLYIAVCEGDDYWTDCYKLQKQVDYLKAHPQCALVYTASMIYNEGKQQMERAIMGEECYGLEHLLTGNSIPTLTACFRKDAFLKYMYDIQPQQRKWLMGDYPIWLWMSHHYQIKFMPETTGVYRVLANSASHSTNPLQEECFNLSDLEIREFFRLRFNAENSMEYRKAVNGRYLHLYYTFLRNGFFRKAMHYRTLLDYSLLSKKDRKRVRLFLPKFISRYLRNKTRRQS